MFTPLLLLILYFKYQHRAFSISISLVLNPLLSKTKFFPLKSKLHCDLQAFLPSLKIRCVISLSIKRNETHKSRFTLASLLSSRNIRTPYWIYRTWGNLLNLLCTLKSTLQYLLTDVRKTSLISKIGISICLRSSNSQSVWSQNSFCLLECFTLK